MPGDLLFFCTIRAFDVLLLYRTPCLDSSVCYPQHSFPKPCGLEFSQHYLSTLDLSYEKVSIQYDRLQTYPSESSVNCLVAWPLEISTFPFSFSQEFDLGYSYFRLFSMWLHKIFLYTKIYKSMEISLCGYISYGCCYFNSIDALQKYTNLHRML